MARRLDGIRLAVLMLGGIALSGPTNIIAVDITADGVKIPLGLCEGSSEHATVATARLSDLIKRGPDTTQGVLCVIDGAQAPAHGDSRRSWRTRRCSAVSATTSDTSWVTRPSVTGRWYAGYCERRGLNHTTIELWSAWRCLPASWPAAIPRLPVPCARGSPRR